MDLSKYYRFDFFDFEWAPSCQRLEHLGRFFRTLIAIPFCIGFKIIVTTCRASLVALGLLFLLLTFAAKEEIREFFVRRVFFLAKDVSDWILFPFSLTTLLVRRLLGALFASSKTVQIR